MTDFTFKSTYMHEQWDIKRSLTLLHPIILCIVLVYGPSNQTLIGNFWNDKFVSKMSSELCTYVSVTYKTYVRTC